MANCTIHLIRNKSIKGINRYTFIAVFFVAPPVGPFYYIVKLLIFKSLKKKNLSQKEENENDEEEAIVMPSKEETLQKAKLNAQQFKQKKA